MNQGERFPGPAELRVTVDTNLLDPKGLRLLLAAVNDLPVEVAMVTVSERESGRRWADLYVVAEGAVWDESEWGRSVWSGPIRETLVLDESRLGDAVLGAEDSADLMENILKVIAGGSFPRTGDRAHLSDGQRRQLRDAMILEAHTRHRRDIFVTKDERGFIRSGRRDDLQRLCSTRIMTPDEFFDFCRPDIAKEAGTSGAVADVPD